MSTSTSVKPVYITAAEVAKHLRKALREAFPRVKFSVRTDNYSGGSAINVGWVDGPQQDAVERVAKRYQFGTFDGMTDCMSYRTVEIEGVPCRGGADHVFAERRLSPERVAALTAIALAADPTFEVGKAYESFQFEGGRIGRFMFGDGVLRAIDKAHPTYPAN